LQVSVRAPILHALSLISAVRTRNIVDRRAVSREPYNDVISPVGGILFA
jgi:hypothetical protein